VPKTICSPLFGRDGEMETRERIVIAAEDRGERLLGRSLKKGKDKEVTKEKEKN
jgi:hypothetical protein